MLTNAIICAATRHAIFQRAVDRLMSNRDLVARQPRVKLSAVNLEMREALEATGPGMYTDVVIGGIAGSRHSRHLKHVPQLNLKRPSLHGDVLVMPINAFETGNQGHSHSGEFDYGDKFVEHHLRRS